MGKGMNHCTWSSLAKLRGWGLTTTLAKRALPFKRFQHDLWLTLRICRNLEKHTILYAGNTEWASKAGRWKGDTTHESSSKAVILRALRRIKGWRNFGELHASTWSIKWYMLRTGLGSSEWLFRRCSRNKRNSSCILRRVRKLLKQRMAIAGKDIVMNPPYCFCPEFIQLAEDTFEEDKDTRILLIVP